MSEKRRPSIEVRIGPGDLADVVRAAQFAAELGADRIGLDTPLIYAHGLGAIAAVRQRVESLPILANLTIHDGCYRFLALAHRHGATAGTVTAIHNYSGCREGVRCGRATGVEIFADMTCIAVEHLARQAQELQAIGVDGLVVSHGHDPALYETTRRESDGLEAVVGAVAIPVACVVGTIPEGHRAAEQGADWLVLKGFSNAADPGALREALTTLRERTYARRATTQTARNY